MANPEATPRGSRETRLLLVTIAVSVAVLLLLARFRFPDQPATQSATTAPAPLERLAARATYDELAASMVELERRIAARVAIVRSRDAEGLESFVVAPRLLPDRAIALVDGAASISATGGTDVEVLARDEATSIVVVRVPAVDDGAVTLRQGPPRPGPRYVAVVDASAAGPTVRPVYVSRVDQREGGSNLQMSGLQLPLNKGSAVFALDGAFLGLVREPGTSVTVVSAEALRNSMERARPTSTQARASLGIDVDVLTPALARATGADSGVVVVRVHPDGPAADSLQPGDVVQAINGVSVSAIDSFRRIERSIAPGSSVAVTGIRRRAPLEATIEPAERPSPTRTDGTGFIGRNVPGAGIEVVAVADDSAASAAGLLRGDLITFIDGRPARDAAALTRAFGGAEPGTALLLTVQRNQRHLVVPLEKR